MIFKEFTELVMKNSVLFGISVAVLSTFINQFLFSFINDIILPIIDRDGDDDKEPDINKITNYTVKVHGITFKVGSFIVSIIRFVIIIIILFLIASFVIKMK